MAPSDTNELAEYLKCRQSKQRRETSRGISELGECKTSAKATSNSKATATGSGDSDRNSDSNIKW
jgi:hypothetical protein